MGGSDGRSNLEVMACVMEAQAGAKVMICDRDQEALTGAKARAFVCQPKEGIAEG